MGKFELKVLIAFALFFVFICFIALVFFLHIYFKWKEGQNAKN